MSNKARVDITLHNVTLAMLDAAGCDTSADVPLILIDAPARKLTLAQAAELHARLGALLAEQFDATLTSLRTRARNHGRIEHTDPVTDKPPREIADKPTRRSVGCVHDAPVSRRLERQREKLTNCATSLGRAIITLRTRRGWSLFELARRSGINDGNLSRVENHGRGLSKLSLRALERAFELPPGALDSPAQFGLPDRAAGFDSKPMKRTG